MPPIEHTHTFFHRYSWLYRLKINWKKIWHYRLDYWKKFLASLRSAYPSIYAFSSINSLFHIPLSNCYPLLCLSASYLERQVGVAGQYKYLQNNDSCNSYSKFIYSQISLFLWTGNTVNSLWTGNWKILSLWTGICVLF